ncbi:MAG: type II secretion system major pseudopilin GspG [Gammaproteobacteria bacterium]
MKSTPRLATYPGYARGQGFTLIELLVVLVILGLLAGLVGPQLLRYIGTSKTETALLQTRDLAAAVELYYIDVGAYPSTAQGLQALVQQPAGVQRWNGPYLRGRTVPMDPWGRPYNYRFPGQHGQFDVWSNGADGQPEGTGENRVVGSWQ